MPPTHEGCWQPIDHVPSLPTDISEFVLVALIRSTATCIPKASPCHPPRATDSVPHPDIVAALHVLPYSAAPLVTRVALEAMPHHRDMDIASSQGMVKTLSLHVQLSRASKRYSRPLALAYTSNAIDYVGMTGKVASLDWWAAQNELPLKYTHLCMDFASQSAHINILSWWKQSGLECKYTESAMDDASWAGHVHVLSWWKASGLDLKYSQRAIGFASSDNKLSVLQWWLDSGLELLHSCLPLIQASTQGHIETLQWWLKNGLSVNTASAHIAMTMASRGGHTDVLQLWASYGFTANQKAAHNAKLKGIDEEVVDL
ncbi:hypothetical protein BCR44DRAFT_1485473 [Catenaria anguillulae PL171]|uniref:Ankyrin repeat-containing domain protein n=1 Tax=Catenaria anguillulae PL171 TaxID=765915 RepID=A0A1Y2HNL9_9FUNG|nr:hypothetical protein BCR44DRAFT_1485473 [Catenaria anguillulae PL171]